MINSISVTLGWTINFSDIGLDHQFYFSNIRIINYFPQHSISFKQHLTCNFSGLQLYWTDFQFFVRFGIPYTSLLSQNTYPLSLKTYTCSHRQDTPPLTEHICTPTHRAHTSSNRTHTTLTYPFSRREHIYPSHRQNTYPHTYPPFLTIKHYAQFDTPIR